MSSPTAKISQRLHFGKPGLRFASVESTRSPEKGASMPDRQISIWNRNQLYVDAQLKESGDLVISGQDLSGAVYAEYEYVLTVRRPDVVRVVAALGGSPGADVLGLLESHAGGIIKTGEKTWLKSHDIRAEFWSRVEP